MFCVFLTTLDKLQKYLKSMQSSFSENCICHNNTEILNTFDPELEYINTKLIIENTLKNC